MALSRVAARAVESGPDGEDLALGAWQRLSAARPALTARRIYPLACLIAIAVCAFTAAGNDGSPPSGSGSGALARPTWPGCAPRGTAGRPVPGAG